MRPLIIEMYEQQTAYFIKKKIILKIRLQRKAPAGGYDEQGLSS